jgi:peptide deformylase
MAVRRIVYSNEPILHEPSRRVRRVDAKLEELIEDMIETMHAANGIGLAAIQIGVPERVVVIEVPVVRDEDPVPSEEPPETELYVLINPEIVEVSEELAEGIEGCLSIPGWAGEVERHVEVTVEGLDRDGRPVRIHAEGLLARVFQHEVDHCEGVLFIDHIEDPEKIWSVEEGQEEAAEAAQERPSG